MGSIDIVLDKLVCHATTEWGHDEVYYSATVTREHHSGGVSTDAGAMIGPTEAQAPTSDRGNTPRGAWEFDDGDESTLGLGESLFPVQVGDQERVFVTLMLMESDGDNAADVEARAAGVAVGVMGVVTAAFAPAAVVTVPAGVALAAVTAAGQIAKGWLDNHDDVLGSVVLTLEGVGDAVHLVQVGSSGEVADGPADGQPASVSTRVKGAGADYELMLSVRDATMAQAVVREDPGGVHVRDHRGDGAVPVRSGPTVHDHRDGADAPVVRDHRG